MINDYLGLLPNASAHGAELDHMLELVHWLMLTLFIGWSAFFAYVIFRFRKSRNPKADYVGVKSKTSTYIEGAVILIEAVLLLGFALPLWAKRVNEFPGGKDVLNIRVVAQQFAWNFHYAGTDGLFARRDINLVKGGSAAGEMGVDLEDPNGKDDILVSNEMHVPVNKPVIIHITSKDVIHSFVVRQMRVTQDAIPGMDIPAWFTPITTGNYEIACAQLCGNSHAAMIGHLVVDSEADYQTWLESKKSSGIGASYE